MFGATVLCLERKELFRAIKVIIQSKVECYWTTLVENTLLALDRNSFCQENVSLSVAEMVQIVLIIDEEGTVVSFLPAELIFQFISPKVGPVRPSAVPCTSTVGVPHLE